MEKLIQDVIDNMCKLLVAEYEPSRVILFGSHSDGTAGEDSDIDLLVIKETSDRFLDRCSDVRRILRGSHTSIPLDAIVLTPAEVEDRLRIGDQFISGILHEGRTLYAA